jgi:hypothetical protein
MSPSLGSFNQNVLASSDGFIVPTSPDYFSLMAIDSLSTILPRWAEWARRANASEILRSAAYPFRSFQLKFLGSVIQRFRPRLGAPTVGFQTWIDKINSAINERLFPQLHAHHMTLPPDVYREVGYSTALTYCLAEIPDFNTLAATSQTHKRPVFALTDAMFGHVGEVLVQDRKKRDEFYVHFSDMADRVIALAAHA